MQRRPSQQPGVPALPCKECGLYLILNGHHGAALRTLPAEMDGVEAALGGTGGAAHENIRLGGLKHQGGCLYIAAGIQLSPSAPDLPLFLFLGAGAAGAVLRTLRHLHAL